MDKYIPFEVEPKWQGVWEKEKLYKAVDFDKNQPKKYLLVEFPYPSGSHLHVGHSFCYLILDALARKKRMEGFNVLYPMGWDAFGLPTENYAVRTGIPPAVATKKNIDFFRSQFKRLGFAYSWDREVNTTNPDYYRWTQWIFIQLFKHGLAYKAKRQVGWCPACKMVLANEEIVKGKCERCHAEIERREQNQWLLRITAYADRLANELDLVDYPDHVKAAQRHWIGRKEWIDINYPIVGTKKTISVSTTRPDTNFGATFVVLAPEHPIVATLLSSKFTVHSLRLKEVKVYVEASKKKSELERISEGKEKNGVFTGLYAFNQLSGRQMPIWITDFVLMDVGAGAVVGVPGHDRRDFEFAQQFDLPVMRVVVGSDGDRSEIKKKEQVQEKEGTMVNSEFLDGMDIHQATRKIMDHIEKKGWGQKTIRYHLRDWIFSRQHYWGEPIPMIYCPACAKKGISWRETAEGAKFSPNLKIPKAPKESAGLPAEASAKAGWFPLSEDQLPLKLPEVEKYQPTDTGESPLANVKDWVKVACPECGRAARRETDTMPNWAGSSWYFLRYCDPRNKNELADRKKLNYWLPVDIYLGGAEHNTLHLLYSRFWHKFLNDIDVVPGKEPYAARRQHGVILGENGSRMSKSRGNVINPEDVIAEYGTDTLRVYLMFMGPYEETMPWNAKGVEGAYRFLNRVWKLVLDSISPIPSPSRCAAGATSPGRCSPGEEKELVFHLHRLIKKVGDDIEVLKYNTAIAAMMGFMNEWQREDTKIQRYKQSLNPPCEYKDIKKKKKNIGALSKPDTQKFLLLLAPFAPHITEELWQRLKDTSGVAGWSVSGSHDSREVEEFNSIHQQPWPAYDPKLIKEKMVTIVVQVNGKLRDRLEVTPEKAQDKKMMVTMAMASPKVKKYLPASSRIARTIFISGKLINFVVGL